MALCYSLWLFGIAYGQLVYVVVLQYISLRFGMLCQEKSGIS
jgi:hypothetical protein